MARALRCGRCRSVPAAVSGNPSATASQDCSRCMLSDVTQVMSGEVLARRANVDADPLKQKIYREKL
jgi:hypothetical protein